MSVQIDNKELKEKYQRDFNRIRELINEFDPCGLVGGGAPNDEYDCLTSKLLISLRDNKKIEEIRNLILLEIEHHFGTPDLGTIKEPIKTKFYNDLDSFVNKLKNHKP